MIIEHRTYTLHPGNTGKYFSLYTQQGMSIQLEYLPRPIGYYSTELGTLNQVIHMWAYDDLNDRAQRRALMKQDPRWTAYVAQILPLIQHQESKILVPASFFTPPIATFALEQEESIA
ncbi:NIPSNAP family protein [Paraburkholderia unamae]|uniref:NIPSNAP protein n=1 Tax=Paraburkholderia unamae TaxID=219649 RepID=A0ABX5KVC7_9BURK|nr:NIPSNAP family protein [Paraburkholderia unamae]PVX84788.1 NIPSNAP protein [Paraburkholderia unamae]RAR66101.1 NIPSNAP protein [Paraburkholderia unamae]CAG9271646.1 NIPSNAP protein [Paraburkholderia unamae]